jgi:hypothetical protein
MVFAIRPVMKPGTIETKQGAPYLSTRSHFWRLLAFTDLPDWEPEAQIDRVSLD